MRGPKEKLFKREVSARSRTLRFRQISNPQHAAFAAPSGVLGNAQIKDVERARVQVERTAAIVLNHAIQLNAGSQENRRM
jgi:hypothetical protein